MPEKCKWFETDVADGRYCDIMDSCFVMCEGEISDCECEYQRFAEEKSEALDQKAEEVMEGRNV